MNWLKAPVNINFYRNPFVAVFTSFSLGIICGFVLTNLWSTLIYSTVPLFLSLIFFQFTKTKNKSLLPIFITAFFSIGCLLMSERNGVFLAYEWEKIYRETDLAVVEIDGVGNGKSNWNKLTGNIKELKNISGNTAVNEPLLLFVKSEKDSFREGDILLIASPIETIKNSGNPGEFDAAYFWKSKGIRKMCFVQEKQFMFLEHHTPGWVSQKLNALREGLVAILKKNLKGEELSIALALILGDKSLLDMEVKTSFTNTGAMHVLAVSGLHVGIIMQLLIYFLGLFNRFLSKKGAVIIVVTTMWIYAIITGLSPSVLRAVIMFSILVLSQLSERNYSPLNALFFTGFVLCLWDPFILFDIGFQLSFLAMLGIFLFYKPIEKILFFENKILMKVWQGTAIGFAAQLMTTPLSLYYFHQFPNYFILTNIGLMASSGIILGGGIFLFAFSWAKPLAKLIAWILTVSIFFSLAFIRWVESLPGAVAFGFEISLLIVIISGLMILIVFTLPLSKKMVLLWYLGGVILLALIVFQRYQNLTNKELCILNARFPVMLIRDGKELFCFHNADSADRDKLKFMVDAYTKYYPGDVRYFSMKKNWVINGRCSIRFENDPNGKQIIVNGKKYFLQIKNSHEMTHSDATIIGMPWIYSPINHSLRAGAFRMELK